MNLGENMRKFRKAQGMTLKQLGSFVGLSEQALSQYERNMREPNVRNLYKISKALNVDVNDLIGYKPTLFQEIIMQLSKNGLTLEDISKETELPVAELEQIKNNEKCVPLSSYIKLAKCCGLTEQQAISSYYMDDMLDAFYNDKNNSPERNKIKKFIAGELFELKDVLIGVEDKGDIEYLTQLYHEGKINYTDKSKNTADETNRAFRQYLDKVDSFEKLLRQCNYPVDKITSPDVTYLFNLTISFLDNEFERFLAKYSSDGSGD